MNARTIRYALLCACGLLLLAEFFVDTQGKAGFGLVFGFHGLLALFACLALALAAKLLLHLLGRPENYYDDR